MNAQDERHETPAERFDRNWDELLQELRVTQTGVQLLTAFLLSLPLQQRFPDLAAYQHALYLGAVALSVSATGLLVAPVAVHRALFRHHAKGRLVTVADANAAYVNDYYSPTRRAARTYPACVYRDAR